MNIEDYLSHFDKFTKDPTLKAMEFLMEKFDNPHKKLKNIKTVRIFDIIHYKL